MALDLTNPGLVSQDQTIDPMTGQPVVKPRVAFFPSDAARALAFAKQQQGAVAPSTSDVSGGIAAPGQAPNNPVSTVTPPTPPIPTFFKPSFTSTLTDPTTGLPAPVNPAQTKLGKLVSILGAAARGAAAGWGYGNAAQGANAAREIPFQEAEQQQQLRQQQAQTALTQAQSSMVPTPYGPMPLGMARYIFPSMINAGAKIGSAQIGAGAKESVAQTGAASKLAVAGVNKRYMAIPNVGLFDTGAEGGPGLIPNSAEGFVVTPEYAQENNLPQAMIGKRATLGNAIALQNALAKFAPTVSSESSTTDLMGNTTTGRTAQKVRPGNFVQGAPGGPLVQQGGTPQAAPARPRTSTIVPATSPAAAKSGSQPASQEVAAAASQLALAPDVEQRLASSNLNPQEQAYVRALLTYHGQMPSPRAKNYGATLSTLSSIDPSFDAPNYDARHKVALDYSAGGSIGKQAMSFNTAIAHLGMLQDAADALKNTDVPALNRVANFFKVQTGDTAVTTFNNIADAVDGEVSKTFKGTATEGELARVGAHFNHALGADQIQHNIGSTVGLLNGKMGEMESAYQQPAPVGMGKPISLVSPQAQQTLQKLQQKANGGGGGVQVTDPRGHIHTFPDQKSADNFKRLANIQ